MAIATKHDFTMFTTEREAREEVHMTMLRLGIIPKYKEVNPIAQRLAEKNYVWSISLEWVPKEEQPMVVPTGGFYSNGKPYTSEEDPSFGNFEGFPSIAIKDERTGTVIHNCFQCPDKCHHCIHFTLENPIATSRRAPYCDVDGISCGKKIVKDCNDFKSDGWKTNKEICEEELEMWRSGDVERLKKGVSRKK